MRKANAVRKSLRYEHSILVKNKIAIRCPFDKAKVMRRILICDVDCFHLDHRVHIDILYYYVI